MSEYVDKDGKKYLKTEGSDELIEVRDQRVYERQHDPESSKPFFDAKGAKQQLRRSEAVAARLNKVVLDRADPGFDPDVRQVTEGQWLEMRQDPEFKPLNTYAHKLTTKSGKQVRPILKGEVGMIGSTIYRLEAGFSQQFTGASFEKVSEK